MFRFTHVQMYNIYRPKYLGLYCIFDFSAASAIRNSLLKLFLCNGNFVF